MRHTQSSDPPAIRIERDTGWAWRGDERLNLTPKAFAVLCHLVERPKRLVTKDELLAAAWGETVVSEAAITSCIRDLRKALDDSSRTPSYIETVHRRGFRFIGPVASPRASSEAQWSAPLDIPPSSATFVGRDGELGRLHALFATAAGGQRRLVFVTGEPGIGKTALVEAFLAQLGDEERLRIGRGQCVEQYGAGEAYLPVLEALGRMGREPRGEALVRILKQYAPTWLAELPALLTDEDLEAVQRRAQGTTHDRMLRELIEALDALSTEAPLVLLLEDLHWSDSATIDLLAMLARRRDRARLLIVATYRPADVAVTSHPLKPVKQELQLHGHCEELALEFLSEAAVGEYLAGRFPCALFPPQFAAMLHENTSGNPLFLVNVLDHLIAQGHVHAVDGQWKLSVPVRDIGSAVPDSLWQLVEKQVDRLTPGEQAMLAVASAAGAEFSAALATADGIDGHEGERYCAELAGRGQFLRAIGVAEWPDGTVAGRYGFIHALYRSVLYARVAIGHRVGLHCRIGARLEDAYGGRAAEIAGELAMHFEHGRDFARAVRYLTQAGENALRRSAHPEAIGLVTKGLQLLMTLPETPERVRHELALQATLGTTLAVTKGYASPEVERAQRRAFHLCQQAGETPQLFPVLAGLWGFRFIRAELHAANELAMQLFRIAQSVPDGALLLWAHTLQGLTLSTLGELPAALTHLEKGIALYEPHLHRPERTRVGAQDPKVTCLSYAAWTLWRLGYPDQARKRVDEVLALAEELSHPFSLAFALDFGGAGVGMLLRDAPAVQTHAEMLVKLSREQGFPYWFAWGAVREGWVLAERGEPAAGIAKMREGMDTIRRTGAELSMSYVLAQLADAYGKMGQEEEGLPLLAEALTQVEKTGERWYEAELHRAKGELLLQAGGKDHSAEAEACFRRAIEVARRQHAKSLELRASRSLARLWQHEAKKQEARKMLGEIYGWFTEGLETADLQDARALLAELA